MGEGMEEERREKTGGEGRRKKKKNEGKTWEKGRERRKD